MVAVVVISRVSSYLLLALASGLASSLLIPLSAGLGQHRSPSRSKKLFASWYTQVQFQGTYNDDTGGGGDDRNGPAFQANFVKSGTEQVGDKNFDLASPRLFLEYCEVVLQSGGAYTVLRCDWSPKHRIWKIWGEDFHLQRLSTSYKSLLSRDYNITTTHDEDVTSCVESRALAATKYGEARLLKHVSKELFRGDEGSHDNRKNNSNGELKIDEKILTVMLTILWTPILEEEDKDSVSNINVNVHAYTTGELSSQKDYNPDPVVVAIPELWRTSKKNEISETLRNRFDDWPQAKLSSWCRRRRPWEDRFKSSSKRNIGEVLLIKQTDHGVAGVLESSNEFKEDSVELLEGLTSNLFFLYRDGTIRTPPSDCVLSGYTRELILSQRCLLEYEVREIKEQTVLLSEADQWEEVFLTSSIRLAIPVKELVIVRPVDGEDNAEDQEFPSISVVWSCKKANRIAQILNRDLFLDSTKETH